MTRFHIIRGILFLSTKRILLLFNKSRVNLHYHPTIIYMKSGMKTERDTALSLLYQIIPYTIKVIILNHGRTMVTLVQTVVANK